MTIVARFMGRSASPRGDIKASCCNPTSPNDTFVESQRNETNQSDDDAPPSVTVLMTSFNRREYTLRCIASLLGKDHRAALRVVLVDDCSSDGTADAVSAAYPEVIVVRGSGALFWAGGMRVAQEWARHTKFDYLLWLNDDVMLAEFALDTLIETERQLRRARGPVIVVGALLDPSTGQTAYSGVERRGARRTQFFLVPPGTSPRRAETMNGNVVLVANDVVDRLGPLDSAYPHGIADYDYGLRATAAGIEVWVAPNFIGECRRNEAGEGRGSARVRMRTLFSPKGIPPWGWMVFTRRHSGAFWPLYFVSPYARVVLRWIVRAFEEWRRLHIIAGRAGVQTRSEWGEHDARSD